MSRRPPEYCTIKVKVLHRSAKGAIKVETEHVSADDNVWLPIEAVELFDRDQVLAAEKGDEIEIRVEEHKLREKGLI